MSIHSVGQGSWARAKVEEGAVMEVIIRSRQISLIWRIKVVRMTMRIGMGEEADWGEKALKVRSLEEVVYLDSRASRQGDHEMTSDRPEVNVAEVAIVLSLD